MTRRCKVFVAGEGASDIGDLCRPRAFRSGREGYLQPILRKLGGDDVALELDGAQIRTLGRTRIKTPAKLYSTHAAQAYAMAAVGGADVVVFCHDVDRVPGTKRSMHEARKQMAEITASVERGFADARREAGMALATVVATPCRTIDAWALGDPAALVRVADGELSVEVCRDPEASGAPSMTPRAITRSAC